MSVTVPYTVADNVVFSCSVSIIRLYIYIYVAKDYFEPEQKCQAYLNQTLHSFINLSYLSFTL